MKRAALPILVLAILGGAAAAGSADLPSGAARMNVRDTLGDAAPERAWPVRLFAGGTLRAKVRAAGAGLVPALSLELPGGEGRRISSESAGEGRSASLDLTTLPDDATGVCRLVVSGTGEGRFTLSARAVPPARVRRRGVVVPAGAEVRVPFPGDTRTLARFRVAATNGALASVSVVGPRGDAEADATAAVAEGGASAPRAELAGGFGEYSLVLRGGEDDAAVDVDVALRPRSAPPGADFAAAHVDPGFGFGATRPTDVAVVAADGEGRPDAGLVVRVVSLDGTTLAAGTTDAEGRCTLRADVPWSSSRVVVVCDAVGRRNRREIDVAERVEVSFR